MVEERYLQIVAAVDVEFSRNRSLHGDKIRCSTGCTECCHHLFKITEIEADHIAGGLALLSPETREALMVRAGVYMEARRRLLANEEERSPLASAGTRLACPALQDGVCLIYEFRPLICHKFGMPLYNPDRPGQIFACELNFKDGEEIADTQLIQIQTGIHQAWKQLQSEYVTSGTFQKAELVTVAQAILKSR